MSPGSLAVGILFTTAHMPTWFVKFNLPIKPLFLLISTPVVDDVAW